MPKSLPSRRAFIWYVVTLITIGLTIVLLTYLRLRPYLSRIDIFSVKESSSMPTPTTALIPAISSLTPTSATLTFSTLPNGQILKYGISRLKLINTITLPPTSSLLLDNLFPRQHYYIQIDDSPIYSFTTPTL